ncbi:MAG: hypothetical protein KAG53_00530 [Endozoicomonadaceae bacterium]|nr:hypothetical protein [Endozoicomonadaceae bacterium]
MKITDEKVECSFRATYSYRIENLQEHKKYFPTCLGRLVVAIHTLFSARLIIPIEDMKNAANNHELCYFAILFRRITIEKVHKNRIPVFVETSENVETYGILDELSVDSNNENRAGKIANGYSDFYNEEWTNLIKSFNKGGTNAGKLGTLCIIEIAFDMILASYEVCMKRLSSPDEYKLQLLQNKFKGRLDDDILNEKCMVRYCKRIIDISRRMLMNNSVLEFSSPLTRGDQINYNKYNSYTKSGSCLDFMVLPALIFSNCETTVLFKGIVQPITRKVKNTIIN